VLEASYAIYISNNYTIQPYIQYGQSVKATERGGIRGFHAHKRVKGRKRHIWWTPSGC
jgi:hypothetical protein